MERIVFGGFTWAYFFGKKAIFESTKCPSNNEINDKKIFKMIIYKMMDLFSVIDFFEESPRYWEWIYDVWRICKFE